MLIVWGSATQTLAHSSDTTRGLEAQCYCLYLQNNGLCTVSSLPVFGAACTAITYDILSERRAWPGGITIDHVDLWPAGRRNVGVLAAPFLA